MEAWDVIAAWFASGAWWALLVDLLLPFAAILVPTLIAVWLARREREAAEVDRRERNSRERAERLATGVDRAISAMDHLVEAAYQPDFREAARIRFLAASTSRTSATISVPKRRRMEVDRRGA